MRFAVFGIFGGYCAFYSLKSVTIRTDNSESGMAKINELWADIMMGKIQKVWLYAIPFLLPTAYLIFPMGITVTACVFVLKFFTFRCGCYATA